MYIGFHFAEFPSFGELEKGFDLLNEGEYYYRKVLLNVQKTSYEVYFEIYAFQDKWLGYITFEGMTSACVFCGDKGDDPRDVWDNFCNILVEEGIDF